jgi:DNA-binding FadR family transcriptional regulator
MTSAIEIFQPITCHFAAVGSTPVDIEAIKTQLMKFCQAVKSRDDEGNIRFNYELHSSIASASHNGCIERGSRQVLADKLSIAQTGFPSASRVIPWRGVADAEAQSRSTECSPDGRGDRDA